jgi:A/G-specific adenine glycosylase
MLQQTQAARVEPAYLAFVRRFPTVRALAAASRAEVLRAWAGLGYNRRAVALQEAARAVVRDHHGIVPVEISALRGLAGVGPYTAAAVASIGHGVPVVAIDTNVRRVGSRFLLGRNPDDVAPPILREAIDAWLDRRDPGSWNQAVMDLGREVCRPLPRCEACPIVSGCRLPAGARRNARPSRRRQAPFEGSMRQVRGAIVRALRNRSPITLRELEAVTGQRRDRLAGSLGTLDAEGLVRAGPAALAGRPSGRIRLPD